MSSSILNIIDDVVYFKSSPVIKLAKKGTVTDEVNLKNLFNIMADVLTDKEYSLSIIRNAIDEIEENPVDEDIVTAADFLHEQNVDKVREFYNRYIRQNMENITIDGVDILESITKLSDGFEAVGDDVYFYGSKDNSAYIGTVLNHDLFNGFFYCFSDVCNDIKFDLWAIMNFVNNCDDF